MKDEFKIMLLNLARESIAHYIKNGEKLEVDPNEVPKEFKESTSVFVTLTIDGALRGCIGHMSPVKELYKDVIDNAFNAAFADPRFPPLEEEDLSRINIEISILNLPKKIEYIDSDDLLAKIKEGEDGIILLKDGKQATFLPQVWEDISDKTEFLEQLSLKAGLLKDDWKSAEIQIYHVEKFSEKDF